MNLGVRRVWVCASCRCRQFRGGLDKSQYFSGDGMEPWSPEMTDFEDALITIASAFSVPDHVSTGGESESDTAPSPRPASSVEENI